MDRAIVWSLRLGFSGRQRGAIAKMGMPRFLEKSFAAEVDQKLPTCLADSPKTIEEFKAFRSRMKALSKEEQKVIRRQERKKGEALRDGWMDKLRASEYPLREKMVLFWHNHFVAAAQKVKVNYWLYQHNQTLRENAFGNFRELTRMMVRSNAVIKYLDNDDNKQGKINENLSRELLELFTLGVGNYEEADIKNGARALAGLSMGNEQGKYRPHREDNNEKTYLGKSGNLKVDDIIDQIFQQEAAPYLITRKILQWFIADLPSEKEVKKYGDYLRKVNFEIKPFLTKLFTEEFDKNKSGQKIKDPLLFSLQLIDELQADDISNEQIAKFIKEQGMELYNPPNVKGWPGGRSWLTAQIFLQRNLVADLLCSGRPLKKGTKKSGNQELVNINLNWKTSGDQQSIIQQLADRLLFRMDEDLQRDLEKILSYDFDPNAEYADKAVLRLFNYMVKLPEFQLV